MRALLQGNAGLLLALGAGVASFVSPCILPIIPSFLSYLGGIGDRSATGSSDGRWRLLRQVLFFVLGFSLVFVTLGTLFSGAGLLLGGARTVVYRVAGVVVVAFGLNLILDFWKVLNIERRFHLRRRPLGVLGSVAVGLAFGAGWTPCVGPVLASILFLAGTSDSVAHGILLLSAYSLGLGLPFLAAGAFYSWFLKQAHRFRGHQKAIKLASGGLLIAMGILIFAGSLTRVNSEFFGLAAGLQAWRLSEPMAPRMLFGLLFGALFVATAGVWVRNLLRSASKRVGPVTVGLLVLFSALSILSFGNILQLDVLIGNWLRFQGI